MPSSLGEGQLEVDPIAAAISNANNIDTPFQLGATSFNNLGPGGEGGTAPGDPSNGPAPVPIKPQPSPSKPRPKPKPSTGSGGTTAGGGGGGSGGYATATPVACFIAHEFYVGCNGYTAIMGGYGDGCTHYGNKNAGSAGGIGPGSAGIPNCGSIYSGPVGVACIPCGLEGDGSNGVGGGGSTSSAGGGGTSGSIPPPGPVPQPISPPASGSGDVSAIVTNILDNAGPGGSAPSTDTSGNTGLGTSGGSGPGGSDYGLDNNSGISSISGSVSGDSGGIANSGGSGGSGGSGLRGPAGMDYPVNNSDTQRSFTVQLSDGQIASVTTNPGEFARITSNPNGTLTLGKIDNTGTYVPVQNIQATNSNGVSAQISNISDSPLNSNAADGTVYHSIATNNPTPTPSTPSTPSQPTTVTGTLGSLPQQQTSPQSTPQPVLTGSNTQIVIVQHDSSQAYIQVT